MTNHATSETSWSELLMAASWDLEVTQTCSPRWLMIQTYYKTTLCKLCQTHIHIHTRAFWGVSCLHVCIWLQSAMLIIACIACWDSEAIQTHSSEWLLTQTSRNTILCKWSQIRMHNHSLRFLTCTPIHIATCVHTYMCIYVLGTAGPLPPPPRHGVCPPAPPVGVGWGWGWLRKSISFIKKN